MPITRQQIGRFSRNLEPVLGKDSPPTIRPIVAASPPLPQLLRDAPTKPSKNHSPHPHLVIMAANYQQKEEDAARWLRNSGNGFME